MITRNMTLKLKELVTKYPVVAVTGPRQSGKTTLVKHVFPDRAYVSLEDPDVREFALTDPRGFLSTYPDGVILDEIQRVPELFSYIQTRVDEMGKEGVFVLTGSHNLVLMEGITQSLAGRVALLNLLPLSFAELSRAKQAPKTLHDLLFTGLYPRIYDKGLSPSEWYANYANTYLERDVRMVTKVTDLARFQRFVKMCAARSGQILNLSALGNDCGITHNTAKAWLSVLQAGFIIFLLHPHHKNFNKRLIKSPKLFFYDPGLLCYLLGIDTPNSLAIHAFRGHIFETWVVGELLKGQFNKGLRENLYFWRDHVGHEVDCIIEQGESLIPLEIKSGETVTRDFFKGLNYWYKVSGISPGGGYIIYGGEKDQRRKECSVMGWKSFASKMP
jgi:predicted AAA+ superfamily ATPase